MGKTRVAINGFGRIGRLAFRLGWNESSYDVVHVNEIAVVESSAYLAKYDSVHGESWTDGGTHCNNREWERPSDKPVVLTPKL